MIGLRERGAILGATALVMPGDPRSATVTTTNEALIMAIQHSDLQPVLDTEPEVRAGMMRVLMERLFQANAR